MRNIKLTIEYDGTDYCGWQIQKNGISVQQCINDILSRIENKTVNITGAGRTDAGVHARAQAANFYTDGNIPADKYKDALNSMLPDSIRITESCEAENDFNARFSAKRKTYKYYIRNSRTASALNCRYEYHCPAVLDIQRMQTACKYLIGEHDFAAFMASGSAVKDTVRTIYIAELDVNLPDIVFTVTGNGFLYKMVRLMMGTLLDIGKGKHEPEYIKELLDSCGKLRAVSAAPAKGLVLDSIVYE